MLNKIYKSYKEEDGYIIIFLLILISSIMILTPLVARLTINELIISRNHSKSLEERYLREGGVNLSLTKGRSKLKEILSSKSYFSQDHLKEAEVGGSVEFSLEEGEKLRLTYGIRDIIDESSKLNINKAQKQELMEINDIGNSLAEGIISKRFFKNIEELTRVEGVGDIDSSTYQGLKRYLTVSSDGRININTAPKEVLRTLKGIGSALSYEIVNNRPFKDIKELKDIPNLGEKTYKGIEDNIKVNTKDFSFVIEVSLDDELIEERREFLSFD
ncbi:helix-hairpin-helix domain-containing protein [Halonatronum saccharophilum]|uniref:helix-hairpin-helix domain-containing protein n=1 Tax=Halonatronum saccharophilum TaxID=150060 RepID=UPI000489E1B9|nr:helix-hairpin-helix domain-containing protein [Halonatronum saccharophilum]